MKKTTKRILIVSIVLPVVILIMNTFEPYSKNTSNITSIDTVSVLDTIPVLYSIPSIDTIPSGSPITDTIVITSKYGKRINPISKKESFHGGIDIKMNVGEAVIATGDGDATSMVDKYGAKVVIIYHSYDYSTLYGHLSDIFIEKGGQIVEKGDTIGLSGNSGQTTGPHLHYEVRKGRKTVDPITIITYN